MSIICLVCPLSVLYVHQFMYASICLHSDNPLVHLNYAIALYNVNKPTAAAKQFVLFQTKSRASTKQHTDPEVMLTQP